MGCATSLSAGPMGPFLEQMRSPEALGRVDAIRARALQTILLPGESLVWVGGPRAVQLDFMASRLGGGAMALTGMAAAILPTLEEQFAQSGLSTEAYAVTNMRVVVVAAPDPASPAAQMSAALGLDTATLSLPLDEASAHARTVKRDAHVVFMPRDQKTAMAAGPGGAMLESMMGKDPLLAEAVYGKGFLNLAPGQARPALAAVQEQARLAAAQDYYRDVVPPGFMTVNGGLHPAFAQRRERAKSALGAQQGLDRVQRAQALAMIMRGPANEPVPTAVPVAELVLPEGVAVDEHALQLFEEGVPMGVALPTADGMPGGGGGGTLPPGALPMATPL